MSHSNGNGNSANQIHFSEAANSSSDMISDNDNFQTIEQIQKHTEPGEILEFQWGHYTHFALYLGQGKIMNIELMEFEESKAHIRERNLEDVCHDNKIRVRNHDIIAHTQFQVKAKPNREIIQDALSFKNQVVPYEFDFRNCEYYCTLWRYSKGFCAEPAKNPAVFCKSCFQEKLSQPTVELKSILKKPKIK